MPAAAAQASHAVLTCKTSHAHVRHELSEPVQLVGRAAAVASALAGLGWLLSFAAACPIVVTSCAARVPHALSLLHGPHGWQVHGNMQAWTQRRSRRWAVAMCRVH